MKENRKKIAVFASGSGTNAERLIKYFSDSDSAKVEAVFCNNSSAGVIARSEKLGVPVTVFTKKDFYDSGIIFKKLLDKKIDLIVLAGFLWLVPKDIIHSFEKRIINIHPALLPGFGGKGFYGINVHKSVIETGSLLSGITIHYVNEKFDDGEIIFQAACYIDKKDSADTLAKKIHELEYKYFPVVVEKLLKQK